MRIGSGVTSACLGLALAVPAPARAALVAEPFVGARAAFAAVTLLAGGQPQFYLGAYNLAANGPTQVRIARIPDHRMFAGELGAPTISVLADGRRRISMSGSIPFLGAISVQATSGPGDILQACLSVYEVAASPPTGTTGIAPGDLTASIGGQALTASAEPCGGAWGTDVTGHYTFGFVDA